MSEDEEKKPVSEGDGAPASEPEATEKEPSPEPPSAQKESAAEAAKAKKEASAPPPAAASKRAPEWAKWAFAVVPAVGLVELGLHVSQVNGAPTDADWERAKLEINLTAKPEDLVVIAPDWVDPLAREKLGEEILTVAREARPDDTRFPRAIELSMRGKHQPEFASWKVSAHKDVGPFVLTTYENPSPVKVIDDLVSHMASGKMKVFRLERPDGMGWGSSCGRQQAGSQTGNIGFGPGIPSDRFVCGAGEFVGLTILPDLDYVPHQCFFAPPPGSGALRVEFSEVHFGKALHGHHAISVHAERDLNGAPVNILFRSGPKVLGKYVHRDGEGWKGFEADTTELAGTTGELAVEVSAPGGANRQYCFEADTR